MLQDKDIRQALTLGARIAAALERIAGALEQPPPPPLFDHTKLTAGEIRGLVADAPGVAVAVAPATARVHPWPKPVAPPPPKTAREALRDATDTAAQVMYGAALRMYRDYSIDKDERPEQLVHAGPSMRRHYRTKVLLEVRTLRGMFERYLGPERLHEVGYEASVDRFVADWTADEEATPA